MKKLNIIFLLLFSVCAALSSCQKPDSDKPWGMTLIYMPQATFNDNHIYEVPNAGSMDNNNGNLNYRVDATAGKVNIFLGVYRGGLEEQMAYTVNISAGTTALSGTTLLPSTAYTLPASVTCPDGKRDVSFYLSVDIAFLKANATTNFSLPVTISDPTRYTLNEMLVTTNVRINTAALLAKEDL